MSMTPEWIAAVTALVAVTVGPFASIYVAKRQIRMSTVSSSRVEWIKQLRDLLADLLTEHRFSDIEFTAGAKHIDQDMYFARLRRLFLLERRIGLMLNPDEPGHTELIRAITEAVTYAGNVDNDRLQKVRDHIDNVFNQGQAILKSEWEVIKRGE